MVPTRVIAINRNAWTEKGGFRRTKKTMAARDPKVPGAKGRRPMNPNVAMFVSIAESSIKVDYHKS